MNGRILDYRDDSGDLLRERGWDHLVDGLSKHASDPSYAPDDLFALVLPGPKGSLRKFACNDKANTVLSVMYFRETGNQLPADMRKSAAQNLVKACRWYGLMVPADLQKAADVSGTELAPLSAKPTADSAAVQEASLGLEAVQTTPDSIKKQAGATMPSTARFADPRNGRYPLTSLADVMEAGRYMDKWASSFSPRERRAMALNIEKRASELGIPVSKSVQDLTQVKIASAREVHAQLELRRDYYGRNSEAGQLFAALQTKLGSLRPAVLAETIAAIDEQHGGNHDWNRVIEDPWAVVFPKRAEDVSNFAYDTGDRIVSGVDITRLASTGFTFVRDRFGKEFAEEFGKDPIGFFSHLPTPEKKVLATLARDMQSPPYVSAQG